MSISGTIAEGFRGDVLGSNLIRAVIAPAGHGRIGANDFEESTFVLADRLVVYQGQLLYFLETPP